MNSACCARCGSYGTLVSFEEEFACTDCVRVYRAQYRALLSQCRIPVSAVRDLAKELADGEAVMPWHYVSALNDLIVEKR